MTYSPINTKVFTAAYAGAIAGMAVSGWITDPTSADYSNATIIAGAFAQSFDTIWNDSAALNSLELAAITAIVQTDFNGRGPGPFNSPTYQSPSNWNSAAAACIALVLECDIYFAGQGITPPSPGSIPGFTAESSLSGDVVRIANPGLLVQAQADSTQHSAGIVGTWDGIELIPFYVNPITNFDSAPIVGQPCYLSALMAGKLTSSIPSSGSIQIPPNLIVLKDYSVGTNYKAEVGICESATQILGLRQQMISRTVALTGINPPAVKLTFSDLNSDEMTSVSSGAGGLQNPLIGDLSRSSLAVSTIQSNGIWDTNSQIWNLRNVLPAGQISANKWYFTYRFKLTASTTAANFEINKFNGSTYNEGIGLTYTSGLISDFVLFRCSSGSLAEGSAVGTYVVLAPVDTVNYHTVEMWCAGDGIIHFSFDGGTDIPTAWPGTSNTGTPLLRLNMYNGVLDYVAFGTM